MLSVGLHPHQQTVTSADPNATPVVRFARLVRQIAEGAGSASEHRQAARDLSKALGAAAITIAPSEDAGTLVVGGTAIVPDDDDTKAAVALLAERLGSYGVEEFTLTPKAAQADLYDLARLLAAVPGGDDSMAYFAARASSVDARGIPRKLREKVVPPPPEPPPMPPDAVAEAEAAPPAAARVESDLRSERLTEALEVPPTKDAALGALFKTIESTTDVADLTAPLDALVVRADLAFRTGQHDVLVDAIAGLIAIEHNQLEADSSDDRRRTFGQVVRKLAKPLILQRVAVLRHRHAADAPLARRLQAILYRYGTDGAEAMIDEYVSVPTAEERTICLESLRGLRRTNDALFALVRDTRDLVVRQAAGILGELNEERGEQLLVELLRHPDARARRAAVAALARFTSTTSTEALGLALLDESPLVRMRAVAALSGRGARAATILAPLLESEPDREVLYSAIAALGSIGTPEAVQLLIRCAQGETGHPRRKSASLRIQACGALVMIRTPQAMACVQGLREERDREVRDAAIRFVAQASRRSVAMRVVATAPDPSA